MLGFMGNSDWQDMSDYLVHLTDAQSFQAVLSEGRVRATSPQGTARKLATLRTTQYAACLSEIPLGMLSRLSSRKGEWGVGFTRVFIREQHGAPVWYLARNTFQAAMFQALVQEKMSGGIDIDDPLWDLTPFVENPGSGEWGNYEFEWEREWRVVGDLSFDFSDVAFLFIPEQYQPAWVDFWESVLGAGSPFPGPMLDAGWDLERMQEELQRLDAGGDR